MAEPKSYSKAGSPTSASPTGQGMAGIGSTSPRSGGADAGAHPLANPQLDGPDVRGSDVLAGGKTVDQIRGYLGGLEFPTSKENIMLAVRRNGAPEDVVGVIPLLTHTEYASFDDFIRDYPRLPNRDDFERAGKS